MIAHRGFTEEEERLDREFDQAYRRFVDEERLREFQSGVAFGFILGAILVGGVAFTFFGR